ncbi:MAG: sugar phosphate isomerase/epimerase family protein [Thermodesulfobacteriota bacterium]
MRLSFSSNGFVRHALTDAIRAIADIGYDGIEILADTPHLFADAVSAADRDRIGAELTRCGLAIANINANTVCGYYGKTFWEPLFEPSLANPEAGPRAWRVAYTKKCIDLAHSLGCPCISITAGRAVPGCPPDEAGKLLADSLHELISHAADRGVRIGIEYEPGLLVESCDELTALLDEIDSPWLGANLDIGHSHVNGEDAETIIARLDTKIFHVHIEDIRGGKHFHLVPGDGDIDFAKVVAALGRQGYDGFLTVELYSYPHCPGEVARRSFTFLEPIVRRTGNGTR